VAKVFRTPSCPFPFSFFLFILALRICTLIIGPHAPARMLLRVKRPVSSARSCLGHSQGLSQLNPSRGIRWRVGDIYIHTPRERVRDEISSSGVCWVCMRMRPTFYISIHDFCFSPCLVSMILSPRSHALSYSPSLLLPHLLASLQEEFLKYIICSLSFINFHLNYTFFFLARQIDIPHLSSQFLTSVVLRGLLMKQQMGGFFFSLFFR
jgi:hypothetical protein